MPLTGDCLTLPPDTDTPPLNFGSFPLPSIFFLNERHFQDLTKVAVGGGGNESAAAA